MKNRKNKYARIEILATARPVSAAAVEPQGAPAAATNAGISK